MSIIFNNDYQGISHSNWNNISERIVINNKMVWFLLLYNISKIDTDSLFVWVVHLEIKERLDISEA